MNTDHHNGSGITIMPDRYSSERSDPVIPLCGKSAISLSFNGRVLSMNGSPKGGYTYFGVSGRPNDNGEFDYSIPRQRMRREGPIPEGQYWIEPSQMWTNHWYNLAPSAAWGFHRITIHIYPGTETYGRGGFFIHGGTHPGSAGCINLHADMERFLVDLQEVVKDGPECYVPLSIRY
ncbi:tlde1 domain-containing protein [Nitrospirillum sp. BR 11752]|uniref:tlde1 domain-containing protein n=1 Tax=Nitrospirillum sp. BR 11752 TaxID=3104293 RepID=UPI003FA5EA80